MVRCCTIECCNGDYKCCNYKCHNYCDYIHFDEFYITENYIFKKCDNSSNSFNDYLICIVGTPISIVLDIISCSFRCCYFCHKECYCVKINNTITQQPRIQATIPIEPKNKKKSTNFNTKPPNYNQHYKDAVVVSQPQSEPLPPIYTY